MKKLQLKGFTLIELLVVISIIALLMAMLLPALGIVKKKAQGVVCQSNLKQCGLLMTMFAADHDGYFSKGRDPGGPDGTGIDGGLFGAMRSYWENSDIKILLCPTSTKTLEEGGRFPYLAHNGNSSYGLNDWIHNPGDTYPLRSTVTVPEKEKYWRTPYAKNISNAPLLLDCWTPGAEPRPTDEPPAFEGDYAGVGAGTGSTRDFCLNRHEAHVNGTFLDSSVRKIGLKQLWKLDWYRNWNGGELPPPVWPYWMIKFKDY